MTITRTVKRLHDELRPIFGARVRLLNADSLKYAQKLVVDAGVAFSVVQPFADRVARDIGLNPSEAVVDGPMKTLRRIFEKAIRKFDGELEKVPDVGRMRILVEKPEDVENIRRMFLGNCPRYDAEVPKKKDDGKLKNLESVEGADQVDDAPQEKRSKVSRITDAMKIVAGKVKREEKPPSPDRRMGRVLDRNPTNKITVSEFEDYFWQPSETGRVAIHMRLDVTLSGSCRVPFEIQVVHKDMVGTEKATHGNYEKIGAIKAAAGKQNRDLTADEREAIGHYEAANQEMYAADVLNYDLYDLRDPKLQYDRDVIVSLAEKRELTA